MVTREAHGAYWAGNLRFNIIFENLYVACLYNCFIQHGNYVMYPVARFLQYQPVFMNIEGVACFGGKKKIHIYKYRQVNPHPPGHNITIH